MSPMIELRGLTKVFGSTRAVDDLTCTIEPGVVTGFLGPNGAGKSTTMRMILGLDRPTAGHRDDRRPAATASCTTRCARSVRCWTPSRSIPNRSARNHLRWIAASNRLPAARVDEVLDDGRA